MTKSDILNDLDYVKTLAEEGRNAPLLGGRIGLWWGVLLCITLFLHWMMETGSWVTEPYMVGVLWIGFAIIGVAGSEVLKNTIKGKPGALAANNRVAHALWTGNTFFLFLFGFAAGTSAGFGFNNFEIMNLMIPLAFGLYGLTGYVTSKISGEHWLLIPTLAAFAIKVLALFMLSSSHLLLVAIMGVVVTIIIPDVIHMRREPKAVV